MFQILHFNRVASTQEIAKMILKENVVVVADEQTEGRGRLGRRWYSPYGGLWMSLILPRRDTQLLTLAASVAAVKVLEMFGVNAKIKWPNDVLVNEKKVCGILGEMHGEFVILGIGMNLENEIPEEIREVATNLPSIKKEALLPLLLEMLENVLNMERKEILSEWRRYQCTLGRRVAVDEKLTGIAEDIDDSGFLLLRTEHGIERITAGTLRFLD